MINNYQWKAEDIMKIEIIICDCCKNEIPSVKKKDIFGIEREYYRFGRLNYEIVYNCMTTWLLLGGYVKI